MRVFTAVCVTFVLTATSLAAKPPLRDVQEIDDMVMVIAVANEIRKRCDDISARLLLAYSTVNGLKALARDMGYTEDEIDEYVNSKSEKKRMRAKAEGFLAKNGVREDDRKALCSFGKRQIQSQTEIGRLLQ